MLPQEEAGKWGRLRNLRAVTRGMGLAKRSEGAEPKHK